MWVIKDKLTGQFLTGPQHRNQWQRAIFTDQISEAWIFSTHDEAEDASYPEYEDVEELT
jgi:hypothetical protein